MKKILLLLVMTAFSWQSNAQYCAAGPSSTGDSNVEAVSITGDATSISYTGCPGVVGVNDQTASSADVTGNSSYTLSVTFGTCGGNYGGAGEAWIDYDQNGVFDAGESIGSSSGTPGTAPWDVAVDFAFTIPMTAYNGSTTMRVMQRESGSNPLDPCGTYTWGSVEDFTIVISGATAAPSCLGLPSGMSASNETQTGADLAWTAGDIETVWDLEIGATGFTPTGTPTDNDISPNTGYTWSAGTSSTTYDVYYRADCGMDDTDVSGWVGPFSFTTLGDYCGGDSFYDNGGAAADYAPTTLDLTTVCPDVSGDVVTVTFSSFATEANWDGLMIHNGNSIAAPIFDSGTPVGGSATNCPAGAYHGTNNPGTLTSTDASGCITFAFRADGGVAAGWEATFTCLPPAACLAPSNMTATNETQTGADLAWTAGDIETVWDLEIGATGFAPTGTPTDNDVMPNTGYTWSSGASGTTYDVYYRADCGMDDTNTSIWIGPFSFTTLGDYCAGDAWYDNGGPTGDYTNSSSEVTTICPDIAGNVVTVTFVSFSLETNWDDLEIHDGNSTGGTSLGIFDGTTPPGPFTSTDASGCLTFNFNSDGSVTFPGWEATFTCDVAADDCDIAIDITDTAVYSFDTGTATNSAVAGCATNPDDDLWYSVTTDDAGDEFTIAVTGADFEIFSGTCGSLVSEGCNITPFMASTLTTYYIRVYDPAVGLDGGGHGNNAAGVGARATTGTIQVSGILLPIQLSSFTGTKRGTSNELSWTTSQEENSAYFMVEKSQNGVDKFVEVGMEAAAGNSYASTNYSMTDAAPFTKSYYRLKMVDIDGSFEYSEIIVIERKTGGLNVTNLYPNPSDSKINMTYETETSEVTIQVINLLGQTIINQTIATSIGVNNYPIDLTSAQSGIYYVTLTDGSNSITKKVVKN